MTLLNPNQPLNQAEGGIYTISYNDRLDLDFEDVDSVLYIGSTRSFRNRFARHNRELEEGHPNWLLKKVGKYANKNNQEIHFNKLLTLPRLSLQPSQYDKILRAVEQWFIYLNRPLQDIERPMNKDCYCRHRLANWADAMNPTVDNAERILPLLTTYSQYLKDDLALNLVLKGVIGYWTDITFKGD